MSGLAEVAVAIGHGAQVAQGEEPIKIKLDKRAEKSYMKQDLTPSAPNPSHKQPVKPLSVPSAENSSKKSDNDEVFDFSDHDIEDDEALALVKSKESCVRGKLQAPKRMSKEGEEKIPNKKALVGPAEKNDMEDAGDFGEGERESMPGSSGYRAGRGGYLGGDRESLVGFVEGGGYGGYGGGERGRFHGGAGGYRSSLPGGYTGGRGGYGAGSDLEKSA